MGDDFRPIETAPRDGTLVEVRCEDEGPFPMRWNAAGTNALVSKDIGIWELEGGGLTWCEDDGFGPTHWRPITAEAMVRFRAPSPSSNGGA